MNTDVINEAFEKMLFKWGVFKQLPGFTREHVRVLRYQYRRGQLISMDKKLKMLQLYGWRMDANKYTHEDLVSLARFCINTSQAARNFGPEYVVEKWMGRNC